MDGTSTTSFLEELTKTDDIGDIRGNGNYPPVPMDMQHQQQQYWQMGTQGMNTRQPQQYSQYGNMNKPVMGDMMSQRPGQVHGGYGSYGQGGQIMNPSMYGYGSQQQNPTNITPPRMGGGQGMNPAWSHQSPGSSDKPPYQGHSNLASPQQQSMRVSGGMYPQGGMGYGDSSGMPQPQRMHNYPPMQGNMSQHGIISPRGMPPQMMQSGRMQGSSSGQYIYPQNAGEQPSRNENMQMNQGQSQSQGASGGQFHSQNPGGMHSQQIGDPVSMQPPQQQQSGGHHQMAINVQGQYQMPGGMMGGQYGGGSMYRMQGYPPSNQQALMMSPGGPQQGMKGYQGQVQYGHNQGYWPPRQMNPHFQGEMGYHQANPNQGSTYNMMPHQQLHQQQYLQTPQQQKHFPSQPPQQQQQLQHQHPPAQQLQQNQQQQQSSQLMQQSNQQLSQPQPLQQHSQQVQQPQTPAPSQHNEMISPQLPTNQATIHHQATQSQPQQNFGLQQYPSQPPQMFQQQQQSQMMSPHHHPQNQQQQQFNSQQKIQPQQFPNEQAKLHSPPPPSLNPQLAQQPHQPTSQPQQPKLLQQQESEEQQVAIDAPVPQQPVGIMQSSPTPPQNQQQRMRYLQQQSPLMPMSQQYSNQQMLQVKISSPQSIMEMPKLTSDNIPSRPGSVQAPQLSPYTYRQPAPQQSQQQMQQQQQYHLPHMDMDGMHAQFNATSSGAGLIASSSELLSPVTDDMMSSNSNTIAPSGTLMQLGNVEDDEATLSTPPPPLLRSCVDFDSDMYMTNQSLPYPPAPHTQPQLHQQLHFPPSDDPFQPSTLDRMTPGMMPPMHSMLPQQLEVGASNKKKRKAANDIDGESKPKKPRKSKKKKDSEDSIENVPTSSLEPDGMGGMSAYMAGTEGMDAFSSDLGTAKSRKTKKLKDPKAEGSSGKRSKTPKKGKTPEEQEANRLLKLQLQSGEKRTKKKSDRKSKMMEGVNEVSSTVETSDPIMAYGSNLMETSNVVGTSAMDEPASFSEPSSDNIGPALTPVREGKSKAPVKPKSKKKKPLPTMFKNKKKKKTSYSGSDMEKNSNKEFSDDDNLNKRRSGRNTKRLKYMCDQDLSLSEDDANVDAVASNNNSVIFEDFRGDLDSQTVDKVLGLKIVKRKVRRDENKTEADDTKAETSDETKKAEDESGKRDAEQKEEEEEVEMFYVKFKNFSYLHCEWRSADELEQGDKRIIQKIKRFKVKQQNSFFEQVDEDDFFNPDYVEVDRVLDVSVATDPTTREETTHYLVKWRALAYEDSTWELAHDVDKQKVEAFLRFKDPPPEAERENKPRPSSHDWFSREECPQYKNGNTLREYQLEGLNWLTFNYFNKRSCILADEMGLGKTIQSITFIEEISRFGIRGPFLIIVPLSTIANWQREFEAWTDLNVVVYHGSNAGRNMLQQYEMYYRDAKGKRISGVYKFNALITTFEVIISDLDVLKQVDWRIAVIDEAHRLKNRNCKLLQGLNSIDIEHRVLLTGTPLQNNVEELFSLLSFLEPKKFLSPEVFMTEFGKLETEAQVENLKDVLRPVMLRRLKEDVEKSLAPKEETIIEVELTNIQKKYYRAILERNFAFLARGGSYASVPTLMNTMMELRKCCNHPFLINGAEDAILEEFQVSHAPQDGERLFHTMVQASGKLVLTDKLLPKLKADGHKVLIFSQMIRVLDVIEDYLIFKKYLYERIDGRIRGSLRQEAIDRFCKPDSDRFIFLLCTRAGGLGINLTAADTVIIYDSDWNPQNDLQAQARCHRIGQQKAVKVYRLITRNTYEREMFDRASLKLGLDKAVLQSMGPKDLNGSNQLSKKEIEDLLKKGAYGALMDDDNSTGNDFCEEDIDHILQRRTQVVQVQAGVKGSTFAKASFSLSTNRMDIDVDDPQFWQKWAKKADLDVDQLLSAADSKDKNALIIEMPRQRRQVSRYGKQDEPVHMSDLESSGSDDDDNRGTGKNGRKGRKNEVAEEGTDETVEEDDGQPKLKYTRNECYNVEKCMLVFGWGRWATILEHGRFKRKLNEEDVRNVTRAILLYSLKNYDGDDKIKMFIYDLISPSEDGMEINCHNHSGLSAPVPRGRKGRRGSNKKVVESPVKKFDGDLKKIDLDLDRFISDPSYKKHLKRHANRILLRIRLLFYLKHTIIGNQADKILAGAHSSEVDIMVPRIESDLPSCWWDMECDKCLLIGVFKHGYERYAQMRQDNFLCFLSRCGPPPTDATTNNITDIDEHDDDEEMRDDDDDDEDTDSMQKPKKRNRNQPQKREQQPFDNPESLAAAALAGQLPFPSVSDLNQRIRKIITAYQKLYKKELMRQEQREKRIQKREQFDQIMKEREIARKAALQNRWSRREEAEFYRLVSSFGVERDPKTKDFKWNRFRSLGHLDKKFDETLTEYYKAFIVMCNKVCKRNINSNKEAGITLTGATVDDPSFNSDLVVEHITEERAYRCMARIELLCRIRERVLTHPDLESRLALCQPSSDLPQWWVVGKHDKDLLIGVSKHGLAHMEATVLCDPELSFYKLEKEVVKSCRDADGDFKDAIKIEAEQPPILEKDSSLLDKTKISSNQVEVESHKEDFQVDSSTTDQSKRSEMSCDRNDSSADTEEAKSKDGDDDDDTLADKDTTIEDDDVDKEAANESECVEEKSSDQNSTATVIPMDVSESQEITDATINEEKTGLESSEKANDVPQEVETNDRDGSDTATDTTEVRGDKDSVEEIPEKGDDEVEKMVVDETSSHTLSADDNDKLDDLDDKIADDVKDMPVLESELDVVMKKEVESSAAPFVVSGRKKVRKFTDLKTESSETANGESQEGSIKFPEIYLPHWPKDRIIIHRLESICNCIEKGEWPSIHKLLSNIGSSVNMMIGSGSLGMGGSCMGSSSMAGGRDSHCSTPTIPDTPTTGGCATPILGLDLSYSNLPNPERISEALDGSITKRRHRRTKAEMEADRTSRSGTPIDPGAGRLSISDVLSARRLLAGPGGKPGLDEDSGTSSTEIMKDVDMMRVFKRRRGRKSKIDKMLEAAAIEAMVRGSGAHPDALLGASGASSIYADWTKMLSQSPSTTPQPQPIAARDGSAKVGKDDKYEDKESFKFSAENLSSDCTPLALTSSSLIPLTQNVSGDTASSSTSLLNSMMSLSASLLKVPSQSSDDDTEHSMASRMMIGQHQSRSQQHSSSSSLFSQSFKQSGGTKVSDLLQQRDNLKMIDDQAMEDRIQSELEMVVSQRQKRRSRLDPSKIDVDMMDGSENVSVIDRTTGKRITGAKAPPIKHLQEWLLRNPAYDVDPKWSHIVKARINLPAELQSRVLTPSGRGRKSNLPQSGSQLPSSLSSSTGYPSSPFSGLGLMSSAATTASTSSTSSSDYYNSMASFMAAASGGPSGSFMGLPSPFSPPLGALANSMYAASLAASMGLLPPIPGGSFGLDDLTGSAGSSGMAPSGSNSTKDEKKELPTKKKNSEREESKSKSDDSQRKKSSKTSSSSMATPDMDMNSLFGSSPFTPFMYNQLLLSQLYAQSLAAFNQMPGTPGFQSPTPFMSSFMPPPIPFDSSLPSSSTSSSKHSSKQEDKKRSETSHRSSGKSGRESGASIASGSGSKTPSSSRKLDDKISKMYSDTSSSDKSKGHSSKHSPQSGRLDMKKHPLMEDLFSSSLMPPPMLDMFGPNNPLLASSLGLPAPGHGEDEPEDLSVPSKKKGGKSDNSTSSMSIEKDPFSLSFKPPSLSSSRFSDDKSLGALPFFMDPLVGPGAMSFLNPGMGFPDLNLSMKSPFEQMGLPLTKREDSKSSKKETSSTGGSSSKSSSMSSKKKDLPPSSSSFPDHDPHSLMPQFMAQDFARYNFMDEQLRMMTPMDIPPFYLPSFTGFPGLYPDLGPPFGAKKSSPEGKERSRKHGDGSHGMKDDRKEKKKSQEHQESKIDFEPALGVSRRLFSPDPTTSASGKGSFNIDQLSIPAIPSDASLFFPPPPPFSFSLTSEPRDKIETTQATSGSSNDDKGNSSVGSNKSLTPKSRSKLGLIDSISNKLLARKQQVELSSEQAEEEKDPPHSKLFDYETQPLFSKPSQPLFEHHQPPASPPRRSAKQGEGEVSGEKNPKEGESSEGGKEDEGMEHSNQDGSD